ncbi:MAG: hypothetical protein D3914_09630 [Candidatus Electrothrix sp. LOE2]|nr:hypothetical protein [Candidatus Electrothrix sp. LOE2]
MVRISGRVGDREKFHLRNSLHHITQARKQASIAFLFLLRYQRHLGLRVDRGSDNPFRLLQNIVLTTGLPQPVSASCSAKKLLKTPCSINLCWKNSFLPLFCWGISYMSTILFI